MMVPWLIAAQRHIGLREVHGPRTEPRIAGWLRKLRAWWDDDETPWCGTFVAACMQECGVVLPRHWYRAKGWLEWGMQLAEPAVGCVVVFERQGGGHVGFVVGRTTAGNLLVLGGNQGNAVSKAEFPLSRVVGYRWPFGSPLAPRVGLPELPVYAAGRLSESEA